MIYEEVETLKKGIESPYFPVYLVEKVKEKIAQWEKENLTVEKYHALISDLRALNDPAMEQTIEDLKILTELKFGPDDAAPLQKLKDGGAISDFYVQINDLYVDKKTFAVTTREDRKVYQGKDLEDAIKWAEEQYEPLVKLPYDREKYNALIEEYAHVGELLDDAKEEGKTEEAQRLRTKLAEIETQIHKYERNYEHGGCVYESIDAVFSEGGEISENKELIEKIKSILDSKLPKFHKAVREYKSFGGASYIAIMFSASPDNINKVSGQHPQSVSLTLNPKTWELHPQVFGGMGGQSIYRDPDKNDPKEKYLAMASERIPFRKPKPNEEAVLNAIAKFAENYKEVLKKHKDTLRYREIVNYDELLGDYKYGGVIPYPDFSDDKISFKSRIVTKQLKDGSRKYAPQIKTSFFDTWQYAYRHSDKHNWIILSNYSEHDWLDTEKECKDIIEDFKKQELVNPKHAKYKTNPVK